MTEILEITSADELSVIQLQQIRDEGGFDGTELPKGPIKDILAWMEGNVAKLNVGDPGKEVPVALHCRREEILNATWKRIGAEIGWNKKEK